MKCALGCRLCYLFFGFYFLILCSSSQVLGQGGKTQLELGSEVNPTEKQRPLVFPSPAEGERTTDYFKSREQFFSKNQPNTTEQVSLSEVRAQAPVGPGDSWLINFWGKIEDSLIVSIDSQNQLFIPKVGVIDTKNMTYANVKSSLEKKLNQTFKNVNFRISIHQLRSFQVYVLGAVSQPGPFVVKSLTRASEAVVMAGGLLEAGSRQFIEISRQDKKLRLNLLDYLVSGDFTNNPILHDNDVIVVPNMKNAVFVSGAITRPGAYELQGRETIARVITELGGLSSYADLASAITVSRLSESGERRQLAVAMSDLFGVKKSENSSDDQDSRVAKPGDEIFVPSTTLKSAARSNQVFVTGEVRAPGAQAYAMSASVDEYIAKAGGISQRANLSGAVIFKKTGARLSVEPGMRIDPGDVIHIPEKTFKFWQDHITILTTFLTLATTVITITR